MYVAVKGGEKAIAAAHDALARERRGDPAIPELTPGQIASQLTLAVDRVMAEGSLYDPALAALAVKQARGDLIEAVFLVRAFRTTLPRFGAAEPVDTARMAVRRRISATFKDLPGGQILGATFDYSHRLIDFSLETANAGAPGNTAMPMRGGDAPGGDDAGAVMARVFSVLEAEGLIEGPGATGEIEPFDITRDPASYPAPRDARLQTLARGDEGFLLALAYSTQRGYGRTHPFAGEIRIGEVMVEAFLPELGFSVEIAAVTLTECEMVNQFRGSEGEPPCFTRGYGLVFGRLERKAMAMSLIDRSLRAAELGETTGHPAQDEEFVLAHCDTVQATGFVEHLKLPHYVDFQSELELIRALRADHAGASSGSRSKAAE